MESIDTDIAFLRRIIEHWNYVDTRFQRLLIDLSGRADHRRENAQDDGHQQKILFTNIASASNDIASWWRQSIAKTQNGVERKCTTTCTMRIRFLRTLISRRQSSRMTLCRRSPTRRIQMISRLEHDSSSVNMSGSRRQALPRIYAFFRYIRHY